MYYSDAQFAKAVDEKLGNVKFFKRVMREHGKIKPYTQFTTNHKPYFQQIQQLHKSMIWDKAVRTVVPTMPIEKEVLTNALL
ncbi:hypothetical protein AB1I68_00070 [Paenibacillus pabuli]|uniref:hypothetical protein n=1 Tax=Paenibacillus pabuli TaxID=1472 RepID=UPI0034574B83